MLMLAGVGGVSDFSVKCRCCCWRWWCYQWCCRYCRCRWRCCSLLPAGVCAGPTFGHGFRRGSGGLATRSRKASRDATKTSSRHATDPLRTWYMWAFRSQLTRAEGKMRCITGGHTADLVSVACFNRTVAGQGLWERPKKWRVGVGDRVKSYSCIRTLYLFLHAVIAAEDTRKDVPEY